MPHESDHDLSEVTTDELLAELKTRFDCCIFCGEVKRTEETFDRVTSWGGRFGGFSYALGLFDRTMIRFQREIAKEQEIEDGD